LVQELEEVCKSKIVGEHRSPIRQPNL